MVLVEIKLEELKDKPQQLKENQHKED